MRKIIVFLILVSLTFSGEAQIFDPITWRTQVEKISNFQYDLIAIADIEPGWHLYSQNVPENGPIPTSFFYKENGAFELVGPTKEEKGSSFYDSVFEMEIKFFSNHVEFRQRVTVTKNSLSSISGRVKFMVCDETRCLPPSEKELVFRLKKQESGATVSFAEKPLSSAMETTLGSETNVGVNKGDRGVLTIFIIAFLSGFAALLTPCVFPMIPMTISYFTKQSKSKAGGMRNGLLYGLCIVIIYVILGTVVTIIFGADSLNALSTNVWFNLVFFLLLIIFAASFLGAFELVLPSSWSTIIDSKSHQSGIMGIFFMALALAIVSFSCTGPIVGTLLVEAASKGGFTPVIGMLGFSMAIAIPFALFAAFPGWLNSLPKSGGWLNSVKVVLGLLELALAFKFLSNADLVLQLHWFEREVFLAIWIAIFGTLAFYLFGKIKLPNDSPIDRISVGRLSLGIVVLSFSVYMVPGLWGAPLQLISGFPPPMQYSESPHGVGYSNLSEISSTGNLPNGAKYGPQGIVSFLDYQKGLAYAIKVDKPILLDFTGYACVNCRKMEERVWSDEKVLNLLKNDVVLISLYVDDKRELPQSEQYTSETTGKEITTIGNKWSDFQISDFGANAQPYYVMIDHDEKKLSEASAYDPDVNSYAQWLKKGINNFYDIK